MTTITTGATLEPDGVTLHLEEKLMLPPGPVTVILQPTGPAAGPTMLEVLDRIQREIAPRTEAISDELQARVIDQMRADDEYEHRWREIWSRTKANPENQ